MDETFVGWFVLFGDDFNRGEEGFEPGALNFAGLLGEVALGHEDQVMLAVEIAQRLLDTGDDLDRMFGDGLRKAMDGFAKGRGLRATRSMASNT